MRHLLTRNVLKHTRKSNQPFSPNALSLDCYDIVGLIDKGVRSFQQTQITVNYQSIRYKNQLTKCFTNEIFPLIQIRFFSIVCFLVFAVTIFPATIRFSLDFNENACEYENSFHKKPVKAQWRF